MKNYFLIVTVLFFNLFMTSCNKSENQQYLATLMTADPGHFHAALVQKQMYPEVNPKVYVYAPDAADVDDHMNRIKGFNARAEDPTSWESEVYRGSDFFEKMVSEKPGNVLVLAGNNQKKTEYILDAIKNGIHVYSDKPMAINTADFELLKQAYAAAEEQGVLLYDIMTERFEITTMLQKELSLSKAVFGSLLPGTPEEPAIVKESVHHFFKYVSGNKIKRPAWFFDVTQEGDGIVDVTTHLVDLIQWTCYPEQILDYQTDLQMLSANRWATPLTLEEFAAVTRLEAFPEYLHKDLDENGVLQVFSNGAMTYKLKEVHARVSVIWNYQAPEGTGDTHYSIIRGTLADLEIKQGEAEGYKPQLYLLPKNPTDQYKADLVTAFTVVAQKYPGIELEAIDRGYRVNIPSTYKVGHEAHFGQVTEKFLKYLEQGRLPDWEVPNTLAKYYTTTQAFEMALKTK